VSESNKQLSSKDLNLALCSTETMQLQMTTLEMRPLKKITEEQSESISGINSRISAHVTPNPMNKRNSLIKH